MNSPEGDPRKDCLAYLNAQVENTQDKFIRSALLNAIAEANAYDRTAPLLTLRRTVEACIAIQNGEAAELARKLQSYQVKFRANRSTVNSETVAAYVHLRQKVDANKGCLTSEWTGPRAETLRRPGPAHTYLTAVQDAQKAKTRPRPTSRQKRLEEIIAKLPASEDRQEMRFEVQQRILAERNLAMLSKAVEKSIPAVTIEGLSRERPPHEVQHENRSSNRQGEILASLKNKLQSNEQLRHFDLVTDGKRLKVLSTGSHIMSKDEYETLIELLDKTIGT